MAFSVLPACKRSNCFAEKDGHCIALADNYFGDKPCPFFKTREQLAAQDAKCKERLRSMGSYEILKKYRRECVTDGETS